MSDERTSTADLRHAALRRILEREEIHSQEQLRHRLADEGVQATQATISRDLSALGAQRIRGAQGEMIYALPSDQPVVRAPQQRTTELVDRSLHKVRHSLVMAVQRTGNLVVLTTPEGAANYCAASIDELRLEGILGTIAGDDTVLIICQDEAIATRLVEQLTNG